MFIFKNNWPNLYSRNEHYLGCDAREFAYRCINQLEDPKHRTEIAKVLNKFMKRLAMYLLGYVCFFLCK